MGDRHGEGEHEFYEDGEHEWYKSGERYVGQFVNKKSEGEFKCYDKEGNMKIVHFKDGNLVEK